MTVYSRSGRCPRCSGQHDSLQAAILVGDPLYVRINGAVVRATHWVGCPTNGQPILCCADMVVDRNDPGFVKATTVQPSGRRVSQGAEMAD